MKEIKYIYKDDQGFVISIKIRKGFLYTQWYKEIKIYIPGLKIYTQEYLKNIGQFDVVKSGFSDWFCNQNTNEIFKNLINDLGNKGLSKKFIVITIKIDRHFYKRLTINKLISSITNLELIDVYDEEYLRAIKVNSKVLSLTNLGYNYLIILNIRLIKKIDIRKYFVYNKNIKNELLVSIHQNFREISKVLLGKSNSFRVHQNKIDLSLLLVYFKKKEKLPEN